jgi:2-polyprenyl-6-methoxyphenol hydroxylase-like FAD-dependent oxidoreductase
MEKLDDRIQWQKRLLAFEPLDIGVLAKFHDGTSYSGLLLVGADGAHSVVRSLLYDPVNLPPKPLPISFLGTSLLVNHAQIAPLLDLDPILFQGCHPESSTWMWFSVMESPETNGSISLPLDQRVWKVQLCLSWPSADNRSEIPDSDAARVLKMREKAEKFDPRLRAIFYDALREDHTPVLAIHLADWHLPPTLASNLQGRVTLVGDAAHTMAMYRGEGFNHAIVDVHALVGAIELAYASETEGVYEGEIGVREKAIERYEVEVRRRGEVAVRMCREATLEVHQWDRLGEGSVVRKRRIL